MSEKTVLSKTLPVAIIGAGPVGLAAAAHLVTRGESFVLFDAGNIQSFLKEFGRLRRSL
jgi:cation diffusion facilitator CzcD-associated flavoprotein CzcO